MADQTGWTCDVGSAGAIRYKWGGKAGVVGSEEIAAQAIPRSNIVSVTGDEMKSAAQAVLNVLYSANPASVGGKMPGDDLYAE